MHLKEVGSGLMKGVYLLSFKAQAKKWLDRISRVWIGAAASGIRWVWTMLLCSLLEKYLPAAIAESNPARCWHPQSTLPRGAGPGHFRRAAPIAHLGWTVFFLWNPTFPCYIKAGSSLPPPPWKALDAHRDWVHCWLFSAARLQTWSGQWGMNVAQLEHRCEQIM